MGEEEEDMVDSNVSPDEVSSSDLLLQRSPPSPPPPGHDGDEDNDGGIISSPPDLTEMKLISPPSSSSSSSSPPIMDTLLIGTVPSVPLLSSQTPLLSQHHDQSLTEEQEFAQGFVKALEDLHKQNHLILRPPPPPPPPGPLPLDSVMGLSPPPPPPLVPSVLPDLPDLPDPVIYSSLNSYASSSALVDTMVPFIPPHQHHHHPHHLTPTTDEPQTVPDVQSLCRADGDAPCSPVPPTPPTPPPPPPGSVEVQERTLLVVSKAERKRLRNRIAATKCRRRKLERISRLEVRVQSLRQQNTELSSTAGLLRDQVDHLKQRVGRHAHSGCQVTTVH